MNAEKLTNHIASFNEQFLALGKPIPKYWDTEWGYWGDSRNPAELIQQANRTIRQYLSVWKNGIEGSITWCYVDRSIEEYCGLLTVDYEKKQSFYSLQLLK